MRIMVLRLVGLGVAIGLAALAGLGGGGPAQAEAVTTYATGDSLGVTITADPVSFGDPATVVATLQDAAGQPRSGVELVLEAPDSTGAWVQVAPTATTDPAGRATMSLTPSVSMRLRVRDPAAGGAVSGPVTVRVRPTLDATVGQNAVRVGATTTLVGVTAPAPATVQVQRKVDGRWRTTDRVATDAEGRWQTRVGGQSRGDLRYRVVRSAGDGLARAVTDLGTLDVYRLATYRVETRGRVSANLRAFRRIVADTLNDPRGWSRAHVRFREVDGRGDFTVVLAQAALLPGFSGECSTSYSCRVGRYVVINDTRWRTGSPYFPGDRLTYRQMLVNHETGHWLGHGHAYCAGRGRLAPVMQQQSKGMLGCRVNPWPLAWEVRTTR